MNNSSNDIEQQNSDVNVMQNHMLNSTSDNKSSTDSINKLMGLDNNEKETDKLNIEANNVEQGSDLSNFAAELQELDKKRKSDSDLQEIKKQRFKFTVLNGQGEKIKGYIDANEITEVKAYLGNEGYQIVNVEQSKDIVFGSGKLSYSELAFVLTQLSTYLKAGIPLIDAIRILEKQTVKADKKRIYTNIIYELVKGESFSRALESQGSVFPTFLINMVKTAEMTGDLPTTLDDMTDYYTTTDRTRKAVVSAMTYPIIIFIFAIAVITFILTYVVPTFVGIFEQNKAELPALTKAVLAVSGFLTTKGFYLVGIILIILLTYIILFKKVKPFRKLMQTIYMKLPIVGNMIIYKEVAMFTKTFASLLNHNVYITDSMKILSQVTSNEVFTEIIGDSLSYLSRGAKISDSFKGKWAFPLVAYEMLVTGENTGRLAVMMDYVANYYDDLHTNFIKRINTLIEPIMIVFLAVVVGVVVLSVIVPMFSFYGQIA